MLSVTKMFVMKRYFVSICVIISSFLCACNYKSDVSFEFPTPPPEPVATPLTKLELKRDAGLEAAIANTAEEAKGKVGVAAVVIETGDAVLLNADQHYPMQSVYKLPISMAVMDQVRLGKLDLDEMIGVTKEDLVRQGLRSPLRDANPNGGEFTIRELIRLALVESDGTASDVLMRVAGSGVEVQEFLTQIGIRDINVVNTEKEIGSDWATQYENWATPSAAVELLRWLQANVAFTSDVADASKSEESGTVGYPMIYKFMAGSNPGQRRLKGHLPPGTIVAHKTGTGGTQNGIAGATNDIGIIELPNGKHLAIAVFVSDSAVDERTREAVIAKISKSAWDKWSK